ncbi:MAG: YqgE/AlgH family protein [Thiotrichales bacterium]
MNLELGNHFLIAMPGMEDPNFSQTLTLICEHNESGAIGFVINRPTAVKLSSLVAEYSDATEFASELENRFLFEGGPVETARGFIMHSAEQTWKTTLRVSDALSVTASSDIIAAIAAGRGPEKFLFLIGYAGWGPGQLEQEILDNAWLTGPADPHIVFDLTPEARWRAAALSLGVDLGLIPAQAGHA